jgi:hypothetical protein
MSKDVECPYCEKWQEINHDDGYGYEEGEVYEQECCDCNKTFTYTTSISFYHEAEKADCLNGSEHEFEPTRTYPKEYTQMRCKMCDQKREPTEKEWEEILAITKESIK